MKVLLGNSYKIPAMCILGYTQTQRDANWTKSMTAAANTGRFRRIYEGILFLTLFKFYLVNSFLEFFISLELFKITDPTFARQAINYYS